MRRTAGFARFAAACAAVCALLAGGAGTARAQGGAERLDRLFSTIDRDASGTLTVQEMHAAAAARFRALDLDGDGTVHAHERQGSRDNRLRLSFENADRDGNGWLDAAELQEVARQRAARRFARLDTNRDGMLSLEELQRMPPPQGAAPAPGGTYLTLPQLDAQMMAMFYRADLDRNGIVTLQEAIAGSNR